jgi:actin related protein 2/3 complex subunit 4
LSLKAYLSSIQEHLEHDFNFTQLELIEPNHPEVEFDQGKQTVKSVVVKRSETEETLLEFSSNSMRMSIKLKHSDELESLLCHKFSAFMMKRAERFEILRKKPLDGYSLTFLVTNQHLLQMKKETICEFLLKFMQEIDKEISDMKISINARGREIAEAFLKQFV